MSNLQRWRRNGQPNSWFDTWFSDFDKFFENQWTPINYKADGAIKSFNPHCDIKESEEGFQFSFDLPGVKKEDVDLKLEDRVLRVKAERKTESSSDKDNTLLSEKFYGMYERAFTLPENIDSEKVNASFKDGVLDLFIAKKEANQTTRQIDIK